MNTVFQRCGNKFLVTKVQQLLRKPIDFKLYKLVRRRIAYNAVDSYSAKNKSFLKFSPACLRCFFQQNFRLFSLSKNRCWKCNAVLTERDLVCIACGSVQEPKQTLNHFEIFKEPLQFDLDVRNLSIKFRRLQTLLHPDKFATRSDKEKAYSAEQSALVNKAYQTLLRPMDRGCYLLELHSKPLIEDEVQLPPEFLTDIMEINENLEECKSPQLLESIRHVNDAKLHLLFADVSLAFKEKNIDKARESLCKLKYFINVDDKIRKLEDELGVSRDD